MLEISVRRQCSIKLITEYSVGTSAYCSFSYFYNVLAFSLSTYLYMYITLEELSYFLDQCRIVCPGDGGGAYRCG